MRAAGRVVAEMHEAIRVAAASRSHDAAPRSCRPRRAGRSQRDVELPRLSRLPGSDLRVGQRRAGPRHPQRAAAARWRHPLDRLWRDRQRLARRRRVHDGASATIDGDAQRLIDAADRALAAGGRGDAARRASRRCRCRGRVRRQRGRVRKPTRLLRSRDRPGDARGSRRRESRPAWQGPAAGAGCGAGDRADADRRWSRRRARARRRLDRGHCRRLTGRAHRAHRRSSPTTAPRSSPVCELAPRYGAMPWTLGAEWAISAQIGASAERKTTPRSCGVFHAHLGASKHSTGSSAHRSAVPRQLRELGSPRTVRSVLVVLNSRG